LKKATISQQVHYCTQDGLPTVPILSQTNIVHSLPVHIFLILSSHQQLGLLYGLLPSDFPTKTLYSFIFSTMRATRSANLIILESIIVTLVGTDVYLSSIQPLGRFSRNQSPVRRPVWLWHAASWASS